MKRENIEIQQKESYRYKERRAKEKKIPRKKRNEATVFHKWSTAAHVQSTKVNCIPGKKLVRRTEVPPSGKCLTVYWPS